MWVFFDEINTNKNQNLLKDLIIDRKFYYDSDSKNFSIPENIRFFAACNPFNIYKNNKDRHDSELECKMLGPVINKKFLETKQNMKKIEKKRLEDLKSKLTHQVKPLNKSFLECIWDFKSLSPEDEKNYMRCIIKGIEEKQKEKLINICYQIQNFIKNEVENNESSVSLRDINRVNLIFHFGIVFLEHVEQFQTNNKLKFIDRFKIYKQEYFSGKTLQKIEDEKFFACICLTICVNYLFRLYKRGKTSYFLIRSNFYLKKSNYPVHKSKINILNNLRT